MTVTCRTLVLVRLGKVVHYNMGVLYIIKPSVNNSDTGLKYTQARRYKYNK